MAVSNQYKQVDKPSHPAHAFEIQGVNLFEQARSAITSDQYDQIKRAVRKLFRDAFDAGAKRHAAH